MKIILASQSPRRVEVLKYLGFEFEQITSRYEEDMTLDLSPEDLVATLSRKKAEEVATRAQGTIVSGDTMVFCEGKRMGKPKNRDECVEMLTHLSGKMQEVITGVTILDTNTGRCVSKTQTTKVWFRKLRTEDIERQADSEEAYECAGAYMIQGRGAIFIERVEGCYTNIRGFPAPLVLEMLTDFCG